MKILLFIAGHFLVGLISYLILYIFNLDDSIEEAKKKYQEGFNAAEYFKALSPNRKYECFNGEFDSYCFQADGEYAMKEAKSELADLLFRTIFFGYLNIGILICCIILRGLIFISHKIIDFLLKRSLKKNDSRERKQKD